MVASYFQQLEEMTLTIYMFLVAMAVVESESYDSWSWFLLLLIEDPDLKDGTFDFRSTKGAYFLPLLNLCSWFLVCTYLSSCTYALAHFNLCSPLQGLDKVVREFIPFVEHRACARHLSSNLSQKHPGEL